MPKIFFNWKNLQALENSSQTLCLRRLEALPRPTAFSHWKILFISFIVSRNNIFLFFYSKTPFLENINSRTPWILLPSAGGFVSRAPFSGD